MEQKVHEPESTIEEEVTQDKTDQSPKSPSFANQQEQEVTAVSTFDQALGKKDSIGFIPAYVAEAEIEEEEAEEEQVDQKSEVEQSEASVQLSERPETTQTQEEDKKETQEELNDLKQQIIPEETEDEASTHGTQIDDSQTQEPSEQEQKIEPQGPPAISKEAKLEMEKEVQEEQKASDKAAKNKAKKMKQKAKRNKREAGLDFIEQHVSVDEWRNINGFQHQADIQLSNLNVNGKHGNAEKQKGSEEEESQNYSESESEEESDEDFEDFHIDGYHPVHVNEIVDSRYICLKKLGWGHFSTVWLALRLSDKQLYALKFQKSAEKYTQSALEEEEILYDVASNYKNRNWERSVRLYENKKNLVVDRSHTHNLQMFDQFFHHGQHGKHSVMAFEVLGKNLLALIKKYDYRGCPLPVVRQIARQTLIGLDYLHKTCNIIHTDLKPENVVFSQNDEQKFTQLMENVLTTPLVELYDQPEPLVLNKKQRQNQKKKEAKKRKAQEANQDNQERNNEEEKVEEKSKAQLIQDQMREKLNKINDQKSNEHVRQLKKRPNSVGKSKAGVHMQYKILEDPETQRLGYFAYEHPLRSYKRFIKRHARTNFAELRVLSAGDPKTFKKLVRRERPNIHIRVRSEQFRNSKGYDEMKPKSLRDLKQIEQRTFNLKLCDMGNACYINKHYSDVIQTREYRSPEVILEGDYNETADLWSLACMLFELITGDYLFDPVKGKTFKKNDDHLAQISELIGECKDKNFLQTCEAKDDFYDAKLKLKRISKLKLWPLHRVLVEKYRMKESEANPLADFLMKMLQWNPKHRVSAQKLLKDSWLRMGHNYDAFMTRDHQREWKKLNLPDEASSTSSSEEAPVQGQNYTTSEEDEAYSNSYETEDEEEIVEGEAEVDRPHMNSEEIGGNTIYKADETMMSEINPMETGMALAAAGMMNTRAAALQMTVDRLRGTVKAGETNFDPANQTKTTMPAAGAAGVEEGDPQQVQETPDLRNQTVRDKQNMGGTKRDTKGKFNRTVQGMKKQRENSLRRTHQ